MKPPPSRRPLPLLGFWLLVTLGMAFVFLGGVRPEVQAILHLMVAAGAGLALVDLARNPQPAGVVLQWTRATLWLGAALLVGLLPVPRALAGWLAPGRTEARPEDGWMTFASDASRVPGELATLLLVMGFGVLVAAWAATRVRRGHTEVVIVLVTGALAASVMLHAVSGARTMLGVVAPQFLPEPFFAPFVNGSHAAAAMLLGGPVAIGVVLDRQQRPWKRLAAACVALAAVAVVAWVHSGGAVIVAVAVAAFAFARGRHRGFAVLGVLVTVVAAWTGLAAWRNGSIEVRASLWEDSLRLASAHWLAGSGGGTFGEAIRAYRSDHAFLAFAHAHNDLVEWVAETGVIGLVALGVAALTLRPPALRDTGRGTALVFGLVALALYALVDFPLQIPALAMAAAAVGACLLGVFAVRRPANPRLVRAALIGVAVVQLPAAAWQAREAVVASAIADVRAFRSDPERAGRGAEVLERARAGGPERLVYRAWSAARPEDAVEAALEVVGRYPDHPDALRDAALVLARAGRHEEATAALERAAARDPADYRPWVLLARIAGARGDIELAAARWSEAFRRSAPGLSEAYAVMPLGLYWLRAFRDIDARYSVELARVLVAEEDYEVALMACEQAATLNPVGWGELLLRSSVLVALGRGDEAERWLEGILSRRPDDPEVLAEYGRVLAARGRHEEASLVYLRAGHDTPALRVQALNSAEVAGGPERALALARRIELEGAVDPALSLEIAGLHLRVGDAAACVREIEERRLRASTVGARAVDLLAQCRLATR